MSKPDQAEALKTCPCCHFEHGIFIGATEENDVSTKDYKCHDCRSTWQVLVYGDGYAALGNVVRSDAARVRDNEYNASKLDMAAKAKQGARNSTEKRLAARGLRKAGLA